MYNYKTLIKLTLVSCFAYVELASAHKQTGSLGRKINGAAATDIFYVTCRDQDLSENPALADHLVISVKDLAPKLAPLISIQVKKNNKLSILSTDKVDGDTKYSPEVRLAEGAGIYMLSIKKSKSIKKGLETYMAEFHCEASDSSHTDTLIQMIQNQ
jgi:hypothetical protein